MGLSITQLYSTHDYCNGYWPLRIRWRGDWINLKLDTLGSTVIISRSITSHYIPWYSIKFPFISRVARVGWTLQGTFHGFCQHQVQRSSGGGSPVLYVRVDGGETSSSSLVCARSEDPRDRPRLWSHALSMSNSVWARSNFTSEATKTWFGHIWTKSKLN